MTEFFYGIGDIAYWFFDLFSKLENVPNIGLTMLSFVLLFWWMKLQKKYNDEAASNPNQLK
jgi:hypothetical protein